MARAGSAPMDAWPSLAPLSSPPRLPRSRKLSSFVTLSTVALSSAVTFGETRTCVGASDPGRNSGTRASPRPNRASTVAALSRLSASMPLTASSSRNSRKNEPSGDNTN